MRIGWLMGWAVPEPWFAPLAGKALPGAEHAFFAAEPDAMKRLADAGPFDWIAGYSLGSLLLLEAFAGASTREGDTLLPGRRFALLAPIFSFPAEEGLGGKVSRAQLNVLARWLARDPEAALRNFYRGAGLDVPAGARPPGDGALAWGLDRLAEARMAPVLPAGWRAWCGTEDPLLDATRIRELEPKVAVVPGAGHHPGPLIGAFARELAPAPPCS